MSENNEYITTFSYGSEEPKENVGPWLKDGKEWWVYDDEKKRYCTFKIIYNGGET